MAVRGGHEHSAMAAAATHVGVLLLAAAVGSGCAEAAGANRGGPAGRGVCWVPCLSTVATPGACVRACVRAGDGRDGRHVPAATDTTAVRRQACASGGDRRPAVRAVTA